jgi:hypothetical protein
LPRRAAAPHPQNADCHRRHEGTVLATGRSTRRRPAHRRHGAGVGGRPHRLPRHRRREPRAASRTNGETLMTQRGARTRSTPSRDHPEASRAAPATRP